MLFHRSTLMAAGLAALLAACSSTPVAPPATPAPAPAAPAARPAAPTTAAATPGATAAVTPAPAVAPRALPPHLDAASPISRERSVFFGFDDSAVLREYLGLIEQHGRYLVANPAIAVRIEGNTDERGSPEYNLALGQRRAEAVRRALKLVGVADRQMEAVSWGEEKPQAAGHDEAAWAKNRRADIVYPKR